MSIKQKLKFEFLWALITLVIIYMVLFPISLSLQERYPFYFENTLIIIIAVTYARYLFFLKHHWITYSKWFKAFFIFFPIVVFFFLMDSFYNFQRFFDEYGIRSIMTDLSIKKQNQLAVFIRSEMILFWAAAFIGNFLMPFKMIRSIYRKRKRGVD